MPQQLGLQKRATILRYTQGNVVIGLDEPGTAQSPQQFTVPMPLAWAGQNGEFIGGYPETGSSVTVSQSQGGQWFINSFVKSDFVFDNGLMNALVPGRALMQVKGGYRLLVDPKLGIQMGDAENYLQADPKLDILSHTFDTSYAFTDAARSIESIIKRDLAENSTRGLVGSALTSHIYDNSLFKIGLDPTAISSTITSGDRIRNPALVEKREIIYEFSDGFDVDNDINEAGKYVDNSSASSLQKLRRDNRTDVFSMSQVYPNYLIEHIKGTGVDCFGNILDLNRNVLPIGKLDNLSLRKNPDKNDAFARIKAQHRKALAYHFEINTKKGIDKPVGDTKLDPGAILFPPPDTDNQTNYARNRSKFFIDIDKEGQFKINIPASSETGNIPLLTRYENYSTLLAKQDTTINANSFIRNPNLQDVFLESFAGKPTIKLSGSDSTLDGYEAPLDRFTQAPIMLGTAYHDISNAMLTFLTKYTSTLTPFDTGHNINKVTKLEQIINPTITVSGPSANAGGRSGMINFDGMLTLNMGANTIDRQSLWMDFAGGIVSQVGRDKNGISYAANLDGDMFIQIGGAGVGNTFDSRFTDQNDGARAGKFDLRILNGNGMMTILRIESTGVSIVTPGRLDISSGQDIILKSKGSIHFNAEEVYFFSDTTSAGNPQGLMRKVLRKQATI